MIQRNRQGETQSQREKREREKHDETELINGLY